MQDTKATTTANAQAAGGDVSIGLALALAIVDDEVTATISRNIHAGGAVGLTANGSSDNESDAIAGARGAQSQKDNQTAGRRRHRRGKRQRQGGQPAGQREQRAQHDRQELLDEQDAERVDW